MSAKLRIWVLVLVTLCLQVPAGASLRVCLCGLESLFAEPVASCCAPVERTSCCAAAQRVHERTQAKRDGTCHGSERCGCHVVRAPERDGASTVPSTLPAAEHTLAPCSAEPFVFTFVRATPMRELRVRVCEPPGRRRNLPLLI